MFILGIIPARAGSKGIKNKNIIPIAEKPLIAHSIEVAKNSSYISDFLVSTDSPEIADVAISYGATAPFLRPSELATDVASTLSVVQHAIRYYEESKKIKIDVLLLLQPTSPLRTTEDVNHSIKLFQNSINPTSLISCYEGNFAHPQIMYKFKDEITSLGEPYLTNQSHGERRQNFTSVYIRNGAIYLAKRSLVMDNNRIYCENPILFQMPRSRSINIDSLDDIPLVEFYLLQKNQQKNENTN